MNKNDLGIEKIKEIAHKISEERRSYFDPTKPVREQIKTCIDDEVYEISKNHIVGCNITINYGLQFVVRSTDKKDIFEIYAEDSEQGEFGSILISSKGDKGNIARYIHNNFDIAFYDVSITAIGEFYKPNNGNKLNQILADDENNLICLLNFLEENKVITVNNYENLTDVLIQWNLIEI